MLNDDDKLMICRTLDNCWLFNLTKQNMCQEIFQTYNRVWNRFHNEVAETQEPATDSTKFKRLLEDILNGDALQKFTQSNSLTDLSQVFPLIHNDQYIAERYNTPFSLSNLDEITPEDTDSATAAHREFNQYLTKVRSGSNNKTKKKFISKLARILYVVRSNIAHGSKLQYQGSRRNEEICDITYRVLLDISNIVLDNGLFRIAAYGELRREGRLFEPLVTNNSGIFVDEANVVGGVISADNSMVFNESSEFERTSVEILNFDNGENIEFIDLVECMPRTLVPYYQNGTLGGFAWIYHRFIGVENAKGPIGRTDRNKAMKDRCSTFLYTLISLRHIYKSHTTPAGTSRKKFFGKLTIEIGTMINFSDTADDIAFSHPFAPNLIEMIDEIGKSFNLIFNRSDLNLPFSHMISGAIREDKEINKQFYDRFETDGQNEIAQQMYTHLVEEIIGFIALWVCETCGDYDGTLWENLNPQSSNMVN